MNTKAPKLSVIMPVYNAEKYLKEAIESILNQTFKDFEFLIINDASSDFSNEIIKSFTDQRIKHLSLETNQGLISVLNQGIDLAIGQYIARMDADDISEPNRFEKQVKVLDNDPSIGICGTWFTLFEGENTNRLIMHPASHDEITQDMLLNCAIGHPTVMGRTFLFKEHLYNQDFYAAEDYELWSRLIGYTHFFNIQESLLRYRWHGFNISVRKANIQKKNTLAVQTKLWEIKFPHLSETEKSHVMEAMQLSEKSSIQLGILAQTVNEKILKKTASTPFLTTKIKNKLDIYIEERIRGFTNKELLATLHSRYFAKLISFRVSKLLLKRFVKNILISISFLKIENGK